MWQVHPLRNQLLRVGAKLDEMFLKPASLSLRPCELHVGWRGRPEHLARQLAEAHEALHVASEELALISS